MDQMTLNSTDFNIISVPKLVDLSEVIKTLKKTGMYMSEARVVRDKGKIFIMNYQGVVLSIDANGHISNFYWSNINNTLKDIYLYWIAGTIIIDDLTDEEEAINEA